MRALAAGFLAVSVPLALLAPTPAAQAAGMTLDPSLPAADVTASPTADGGATITLVSPAPEEVCVWGVEWDTDKAGDHGFAPGLRPGGSPPSQQSTIPPVCGSGVLPTTIHLSAGDLGPDVTSIRVVWTPIADTSTHSPYVVLPWPVMATDLSAALDPVATEQPDGSIVVDFTDPNPPGSVCVWRWEIRRGEGVSAFGAGTQARDPSAPTSCESSVIVPADLDDPTNVDLVMWPMATGAPASGDPAAITYVDLPDVDLSAPVATGGAIPPPALALRWWTSQQIAASVPRAEVSAPGGVKGTCSYRIQWQAPGIAPRGVWVTGACAGAFIELPQLAFDASKGWSDTWAVQAAWAEGVVGAKPKTYSPYRQRTWLTGGELPDASTIQLTSTGTGTSWFVSGPAPAACNAQVQLLSSTDPSTWSVVSDTLAVPLGLCDDLWSQHPIPTTDAAAIRVRLISSTAPTPVGRWMYASLQRPADPTDAQVRWNDAGIPVVTFTDPNPAGTVCFWQISAKDTVVDDITVDPDGSTTCSTTTSLTMSGDIDWTDVSTLLIRSSSIPEITAIEGWGPLAGAVVPYSPRLAAGKGSAPTATLVVDEAGYPGVMATGTGCRFVAQWRYVGEPLWRTEPMTSSSACNPTVALVSAGPTDQRLEARIAKATVTGDAIAHGAWSQPVATLDPIPVPEVTFYPGTNRVRIDNQPTSLCGAWFEVRRDDTVVVTSLVRGADVTGALLCGPQATDSRMSTYVPQPGDEVRFAFVRGIEDARIFGPWSPWQAIPTDSQAPVVTVVSPATQSKVKGEVGFVVTATDDVGIDRIEIRTSGILIASSSAPPASGDTWLLDWDSTPYGKGPTLITINVIDTSGNLTSVERLVVLGNPPPLKVITGKAAKKATVITLATPPAPTIPKAPVVDVTLKKPFRLALAGKAFVGAAISVRTGIGWSKAGTISAAGTSPALRITVAGIYRVRLDLANGKTRFVHMRS